MVLVLAIRGSYFSEEIGATVCVLVLLVAVLRFVLCSFEDKASQSNPNILSGV